MQIFVIAWLLGAACLNLLPKLPSIELMLLIGISLICVALLALGTYWQGLKLAANNLHFTANLDQYQAKLPKSTQYLQISILILIGLGLGFSYVYLSAKARSAKFLPNEIVNKAIFVDGIIISDVYQHGHYQSFNYKILPSANGSISRPITISTKWPKSTVKLAKGDFVSAKIILKPPISYANPGGYDVEKQFFIDNIQGTGKLYKITRLGKNPQSSIFSRWRKAILHILDTKLANARLIGIIEAMVIGDRSKITYKMWDTLSKTGTSHLVAISGLHVGLVALFAFGFFRFCLGLSQVIALRLPINLIASLGAFSSAFIYSVLAGFGLPAQRALIMLGCTSLALLSKRKAHGFNILALAALIVNLIDPFAILRVGFWLSFGCVAVLLYSKHYFTGSNQNFFRKWVLPQLLIWLGMLPMSLLFFQQVSLISPVANFFAIPIISFLVVPFCLLGGICAPILGFLSGIFFKLAYIVLDWVWFFLNLLANFKLSNIATISYPKIWLFCVLLGSVWLLSPLTKKSKFKKRYAWICFLPLFFYNPNNLSENQAKITVLDVGQGLSVVIKTKHHTVLYDAGPKYGYYSNAGNKVIIPFLKSQGINKLDKIIISHGDLDHKAGLEDILKNMKNNEIISSDQKIIDDNFGSYCNANSNFELDGVKFQFLNPEFKKYIKSSKKNKRNNLSCVLKITANNTSALLTGDIETPVEQNLLKNYPEDFLRSDILLVPHHGSKTSSSVDFIQAVNPKYAIFPVGYLNIYGFPKTIIINRYKEQNAKNYVTYQTGAVSLLIKNNKISVAKYRENNQKYWMRDLTT